MSYIPSRVCFPYYLTRDVKLDVKVKICRAECLAPASLTASAVIKSAQRALHQSATATSLPVTVFPNVSWEEWLVFPARYSDLSPDAEIEIVLRDQGYQPVYHASLSLFNEHQALKIGAQRIRLHAFQDGEQVALEDNNERSKCEDNETCGKAADSAAFRLITLAEKYEQKGDKFKIKWLDRLLKERIEMEKKDQLEIDARKSLRAHIGSVMKDDGNIPWLIVELPLFRIPIIASEKPYTQQNFVRRLLGRNDQEWLANVDADTGKIFYQGVRGDKPSWRRPDTSDKSGVRTLLPLLTRFIDDKETERDNPCLQKTMKLFRSGNAALQKTKPNKKQAADIEKILKSPILKNNISPIDASLLWQFRHVLCTRGDALVKFLYAVDKADAHDIKQALELLEKWAPIEVADALILLSEDFTHDPNTENLLNVAVRRYAVDTLQKSASDADLRLYLLQLVQALRYEPDLKALQQQQAASGNNNPSVEADATSLAISDSSKSSNTESDGSLSPLADLLLERCVNNHNLSNFFHWFVEVETHAHGVGDLFSLVLHAFHTKLAAMAPDVYLEMSREQELVMKFVALGTEIQNSGGNASSREKKMRALLGDGGTYGDLRQLDESIPMPHMPSIRVKGLIAEKTKVFKSALCPFVLAFIIDDVPPALNKALEIKKTLMDSGEDALLTDSVPVQHAVLSKRQLVNSVGYSDQQISNPVEPPALLKVMMKIGDDLRQDQLIMQMVQLMDTILKRVNLDLKLTPYAVLAVSRTNGMLEFLADSPIPLADVKNIRLFLASKHPSRENDLGIRPDILDNFVRSCAGSAVMTWILAVGDRHLHNIMLQADTGKLVHIDFGYIFGKEPKQNATNIRMTKSMVEAMGGENSKYFNQFKNLAGQAFNILRRHANLILALLKLMAQADLEDCSAEDFKVVQDRFLIGRSDEEAERHLMSEIEFAVHNKWMAVMDIMHDVATSWR